MVTNAACLSRYEGLTPISGVVVFVGRDIFIVNEMTWMHDLRPDKCDYGITADDSKETDGRHKESLHYSPPLFVA
jgi:hypothetical protein